MRSSDTLSETADQNRGKSHIPTIATVGIMTADRPALLHRALASYIENNHQRNDVEYVVYDDSKDAAMPAASFAVAQKLARQFGVPIRFAGIQERQCYARQLGESGAIAPELLECALLNPRGYTLGQNRNTLLLDTVGSTIFCADDDTVCTPVQLSETHTDLQLATDGDPAKFWCYRNKSETDALSPPAAEMNALAAHEQLLGKNVADLTDHQPGNFKPVNQRSEELIRRVERPDSVVRVTFNGLVGDCAWGSPFGFWHEPMGYLAFAGSSLERLTRAEEFYQQALQSRQLLRVTAGPYLADASFSMLTFCGLDNRELLPPNLPTHRGQDLIFGEILWTCFTDSLFGHLPFALAHDPLPPRRFWPGEITRSASGVDLCRVLIEAMRLLPEQDARANPAERLSMLGTHLMRLAKLPPHVLGGKLIAALRVSNQQFKHVVMDRGAALMNQAPYYANDITRYFDKQKKAEVDAHYWIPLDLCGVDGLAAALFRLRRALEMFGALLEHWPAIVRAARALRVQNIRVSIAV
jgi:hypothetical protein